MPTGNAYEVFRDHIMFSYHKKEQKENQKVPSPLGLEWASSTGGTVHGGVRK
jgi:hypothetical protein